MSEQDVRPENDAEERRRLGDRLREARKYLGLKQEEVAGYLKIPRTALTDTVSTNPTITGSSNPARASSIPTVRAPS